MNPATLQYVWTFILTHKKMLSRKFHASTPLMQCTHKCTRHTQTCTKIGMPCSSMCHGPKMPQPFRGPLQSEFEVYTAEGFKLVLHRSPSQQQKRSWTLGSRRVSAQCWLLLQSWLFPTQQPEHKTTKTESIRHGTCVVQAMLFHMISLFFFPYTAQFAQRASKRYCGVMAEVAYSTT